MGSAWCQGLEIGTWLNGGQESDFDSKAGMGRLGGSIS